MAYKVLFIMFFSIILYGCSNIPEGIKPVENFDLNRYAGKWYEVARLDHNFEKNLEKVTAEYSLLQNKEGQKTGKVKVVNRGYNVKKGEWKKAVGKAKFFNDSTVGHLQVSFFGPFYGSYIVFYLDENYENALVAGPNKKYFWWLSRTPNYEDSLKQEILAIIKEKGYRSEEVIFVKH